MASIEEVNRHISTTISQRTRGADRYEVGGSYYRTFEEAERAMADIFKRTAESLGGLDEGLTNPYSSEVGLQPSSSGAPSGSSGVDTGIPTIMENVRLP